MTDLCSKVLALFVPSFFPFHLLLKSLCLCAAWLSSGPHFRTTVVIRRWPIVCSSRWIYPHVMIFGDAWPPGIFWVIHIFKFNRQSVGCLLRQNKDKINQLPYGCRCCKDWQKMNKKNNWRNTRSPTTTEISREPAKHWDYLSSSREGWGCCIIIERNWSHVYICLVYFCCQ